MKKILGFVCAILAFTVAMLIYASFSLSNYHIYIAEVLIGEGHYRAYFVTGIVFILISVILLCIWSWIKLFNSKAAAFGIKIIEKSVFYFLVVTLVFSAYMGVVFFIDINKATTGFKKADVTRIVEFVYGYAASTNKRRQEISDKREGYQEKSRAEIFMQARAKIEDKTPLMIAVIDNLVYEESYENINYSDSDGRTALMYAIAVSAGSETVKTLLVNGADAKMHDNEKMTTLMYAAAYADTAEIIDMLIDAGADVDEKMAGNKKSIHFAAQYNENVEIIKALIRHGANPEDMAYYTIRGSYRSPLMVAVEYNNSDEVIAYLAEIVPDINAIVYGVNILTLAVQHGTVKTVQIILDAGADVNKGAFRQGYSALAVAAMDNDDINVTKLLIDAGADVNVANKNFIFSSALMTAAWDGSPEIVELILDNDANIDIKNLYGMSALEIAAANPEAADVISLLSRYGIKPGKIQGVYFPSIVLVAAINADPQQIELLIERGADINALNSEGLSAFSAACRYNVNPEVAKVFLKHGLRVNGIDSESGKKHIEYAGANHNIAVLETLLNYYPEQNRESLRRILFEAVKSGNINAVKFLKGYGIDMNVQDKEGVTALMYAAQISTTPRIIYELLDSGAETYIKDNEGKTAEHYLKANKKLSKFGIKL